MTTIPQRLREIARSVHEMEYGQPGALADSLRAIAAELEAPAADAPKVVMLWRDHLPDGRYDPKAKDEPLVRQRDHIATVSALQATIASQNAALIELTVENERWASDFQALQARIKELEAAIRAANAVTPWQERVRGLDRPTDFAERWAATQEVAGLRRCLAPSLPHPDTSKEQP